MQLVVAVTQQALPISEPARRPATTAEQRAAVEARKRDVFCEAGAGTGKTRVLVERYCDAVEHDEVGPEAILAFTFTERAAAELRARVRGELGHRADSATVRGDRELGDRLARAARDTERAWVTTIHGFCRRLLAAHPAAAGIDPRFRVLDDSEAARLRRRARDAALDELARGGDREALEVLAAYEPWRLGDMTVAAYERLRSQGMAAPALPPASDPIHSPRRGEERRELTPEESAAALRAHAALDALLAGFGRRYEELKARRSGLDFADLELRALELLRGSPAIARGWRERFRHLMVDEFQDTNAVQLELVAALDGDETSVFRVGDELQSIYRFRNADLAVFRDERERARRDPDTEVLALTGNFRSQPQILAAVNELGAALLGDGFRPLTSPRSAGDAAPRAVGDDAPATELLLTLHEGSGAKARGWHPHADALEPPPSERKPETVAEARALARRLRELVDAGDAERGEVVVLLRAFTHVDAYEEALDRAGLDPYVVGGRGYWSEQQVEDMLRLLSVVANPLDDEMLLGALASPACGTSADALWLLRRATMPPEGAAEEVEERRAPPHLWPLVAWRFGGAERRPEGVVERWLEEIASEDAGRLEAFCTAIAGLRAATPVLALDELVERTMVAFDYDLAALGRPRGRGRMANVRKLTRLAREFEAHDGRDLRGFLAAAEELTKRDEREGVAATQPEDHDGVRVMTVHAAKGLEFTVVAVPDLQRGLATGERGGDVVLGRGAAEGPGERRFGLRLATPSAESLGVWELGELNTEAVEEAAEEGCRLVHVAATRAERRLILSGVFKGERDAEPLEPGPNDSAIRRLLPALAGLGWDHEDGDTELELPPPAGAEHVPTRLAIRINAPGADRAHRLAERLPAPAPPPAPSAGDAPLGRPPRVVPVGHLSYSALAEYERCGYRFYVERLLGLDEPPTPLHPDAAGSDPAEGGSGPLAGRARRLALGNAVHAALEWSARHRWERPDEALLAALLAEQGAGSDPDAAVRARALVDGWLDSPLRAELDGAPVRAEVPFAIGLAGTVVRGQIDLLAPGAEPLVLDYKTDALGNEGPSALAGRYAAQRELYALAAAAANGAEPPRAVRAVHCFLDAPAAPEVEVFDRARLAAARERLEGLIAKIRAGRGFEPTPRPSWTVCNGCPAAARLCPHPGWRPGRGG